MAHATLILTPEQIDLFQQTGYLSLPAITAPEEVAGPREIYDRLFVTQAGRAEGDHLDLSGTDENGAKALSPQILNPSKYAPELAHTVFRANAESIGRQLLGPAAEFGGDHAIRKAPPTEAPTPWHQDEAYRDPNLAYTEPSIWIPSQEATLENGCMQFVPATHQQEVLPHHLIGNDPRVVGLEVNDPEARAAGGAEPLLTAGAATDHVAGTPRGREGLSPGFGRRESAGRFSRRPSFPLNPAIRLSRRRL
jgi:ectoine hydroxylase-related dioxygenase (phytanoyl-CoA dioxygenase family)